MMPSVYPPEPNAPHVDEGTLSRIFRGSTLEVAEEFSARVAQLQRMIKVYAKMHHADLKHDAANKAAGIPLCNGGECYRCDRFREIVDLYLAQTFHLQHQYGDGLVSWVYRYHRPSFHGVIRHLRDLETDIDALTTYVDAWLPDQPEGTIAGHYWPAATMAGCYMVTLSLVIWALSIVPNELHSAIVFPGLMLLCFAAVMAVVASRLDLASLLARYKPSWRACCDWVYRAYH